MKWQQSIPFTPEASADTLGRLPETPAVFLLRSDDPNADPYINKTANLRRRLERLLSAASPDSKRLNLRQRTRAIEYTLTGSDFENRLLLYKALREYFPRSYRKRMKLIPAPLIKIGWENQYPRAYFTRRLGKNAVLNKSQAEVTQSPKTSVYYGPFASKAAANKFLNDALDLFKSRRCTFNLHPDPSFPGCIYSEMKMCLAPCFAGCTDAEYMAEVARVQDYLDSRAASLVTELEAEREAASAELEFEKASGIHGRIEKTKAPWMGVPEIVGRIEQLSVAAMQHANPNSGSSSLFSHPHMAVPLESDTKAGKSKPQTLEARVAEALGTIETRKPERGELADQLALLKRWYYRSSKKGEIFITHSGELPLRRIVRGISRVFRGERQEMNTER